MKLSQKPFRVSFAILLENKSGEIVSKPLEFIYQMVE